MGIVVVRRVYDVLQDRLTHRNILQAEVGGSPRLRLLPQEQKREVAAINLKTNFYTKRMLKGLVKLS